MASKEQIFGVLAGASAPMSRTELEEKVGESYRRFQTQLDRWVKQGLLENTGEHHYMLTDQGREESLRETAKKMETREPSGGEKEGAKDTQRTAGTTEFQQFLRLGINVGVIPMSLIHVTTNHIWDGGNYKDLKWVAIGLQQMGIQRDLANRWLHAWGSHLKTPLPTDLPPEFFPSEERDGKTGAERKGRGVRTHNIDEMGNPVYVGEGLGALTHDEAFELAKIRASAKTRGSMLDRSESPGDALASKAVDKILGDMNNAPGEPTDETSKVIAQIKAIKELLGMDGKAESGDEMTKLVSAFKSLKDLFGDNKPLANPETGKQLLVNKQTGEIEELLPGRPVIIMQEKSPVSQATPIQLKDKDGNDLILDINTFVRLEDHKDKQRRDEESHQVKMDIAKTFKDALNKAGKALANMGGGED